MIKLSYSILAAAILLAAVLQAPSQKTSSAEDIMRRAAAKLASVKRLGYTYKFRLDHPSQNRTFEENSQAYLDLAPVEGTSKFKYQFLSEERFTAYNGSERFTTDNASKKLWVETGPSFQGSGYILLMNSPLALKYALPILAADKAIKKNASIIKVNGREHYLVEFSLHKAAISMAGEIFEIKVDRSTSYSLTIDKKTFLPVEVVESNDKNDESLKSSFTGITESPSTPDALSWYYSSYQKDYQLEKKDPLTLIGPGKPAPAFELAQFGSDSRVPLDLYTGKPVLLEFWIAHCGFCVAAVPALNSISEKFRDRGLQVVSINMHDPAPTIEFFRNKNKPGYAILTGGDSIAAAYGVEAYPALVLIGKSGKVVYSASGLRQEELEAAILSNLEQ